MHVVVKGTAKDLFAAGMPEITTCKAAGNTVLLTWNKYENADSYIILRRKMGESKFAKIATVKDLSYTDTAFSPSTPYYYSVQAVSTKWGGAIKSSYDKNFSVTTNGIAPTPTPAPLTLKYKSGTLKWKDHTTVTLQMTTDGPCKWYYFFVDAGTDTKTIQNMYVANDATNVMSTSGSFDVTAVKVPEKEDRKSVV